MDVTVGQALAALVAAGIAMFGLGVLLLSLAAIFALLWFRPPYRERMAPAKRIDPISTAEPNVRPVNGWPRRRIVQVTDHLDDEPDEEEPQSLDGALTEDLDSWVEEQRASGRSDSEIQHHLRQSAFDPTRDVA